MVILISSVRDSIRTTKLKTTKRNHELGEGRFETIFLPGHIGIITEFHHPYAKGNEKRKPILMESSAPSLGACRSVATVVGRR
mmetsp:Transcript_14773/g.36096  ORF Transcript_14773/g.36096 Transcript_14773/m.36096 type:complete len:83 (+) Transcript_14773:111-359(+)